MEEDIYGGVGGVDEGVYDTAGGVKKGMKYSKEGLYDNPHKQGEESVYDNVKMKRKVDGAVRIAKKDTIDEDIYGSTDVGEVEGFYDDPKSVHHTGMKLSEEGIYDNPTGVKGPGMVIYMRCGVCESQHRVALGSYLYKMAMNTRTFQMRVGWRKGSTEVPLGTWGMISMTTHRLLEV